MFQRAGGVNATKKKPPAAANVISDAITKLSTALSPTSLSPKQSNNGSPAKTIENRSKCYRQLAELKNLVQSGVLSKDEGSAERCAIMGTLHKL